MSPHERDRDARKESDAPEAPAPRRTRSPRTGRLVLAPSADLRTPEGRAAFVNALLGRETPRREEGAPDAPDASQPD